MVANARNRRDLKLHFVYSPWSPHISLGETVAELDQTIMAKCFKNLLGRPCPMLENKSMSYRLVFTPHPDSIAVPYSRGGRSEAQHNNPPFLTAPVFRYIVDLVFSLVFKYSFTSSPRNWARRDQELHVFF